MASAIIAYCQDCGFQKENNFNYCPLCGKEVSIDDEQSLIEFYFYRGYTCTYQSIVKLLDSLCTAARSSKKKIGEERL